MEWVSTSKTGGKQYSVHAPRNLRALPFVAVSVVAYMQGRMYIQDGPKSKPLSRVIIESY